MKNISLGQCPHSPTHKTDQSIGTLICAHSLGRNASHSPPLPHGLIFVLRKWLAGQIIDEGNYRGLSESHLFLTDYDKIDLKWITGVSSVMEGNRLRCEIIAGTLCKLTEKRYIISLNVFIFLFIRDSFYPLCQRMSSSTPAPPTGAAAPAGAPAPATATPSSPPTSAPPSSSASSFDMAKLDDPAFLDKIEKKDLASMVKGVAADNTNIRNDKNKLETDYNFLKSGRSKLRERVDGEAVGRIKRAWSDEISKALAEKIYAAVVDPEKATDLLVTVADNASTFGKQILATERAIQEQKDAVHDAKRRDVEAPGGSKTTDMFSKESCDVINRLLPAHLR